MVEKSLPATIDKSVQVHPKVGAGDTAVSAITSWLTVGATAECIPKYWSKQRDAWLREFVLKPGNDLLAGTMATVVAKVASTGFRIEGPERTANASRRMLLEQADFGGGWDPLVEKLAWDYLSQDQGAFMERIRLGREGAAIGFAHFDSQRITLTGDPRFPAIYMDRGTQDKGPEPHTLHHSQAAHLVDSPSTRETMNDVGFCAVSRACMTAQILMSIAAYERERLSDLPPAGLLMINNLSRDQWEDLQKQYDARQRQQGNVVWRDVMVAFGLDPAIPLQAELFSFSRLPDAFDKKTATEIAIYSFALAFREDPRELWPVSSGPLGTATEANIQHMKARAKGTGMILTEIERAMNDGLSLPASVTFRFDFQDTEEDEQAATIANLKADYITKLWKPDPVLGAGIISSEEARHWLVAQGLFEEDDLQTMQEENLATDVEEAKSLARIDMGPRVRAYSDGRTVQLGRRLWPIAKAQYRCECLDCGHKMSSDEHCADIVCPECGGQMRRAKRPGVGRSPVTEGIVVQARANLKAGIVTPETVAEWALGELIDGQPPG